MVIVIVGNFFLIKSAAEQKGTQMFTSSLNKKAYALIPVTVSSRAIIPDLKVEFKNFRYKPTK